MSEQVWDKLAKDFLKKEMMESGLTHETLSQKLEAMQFFLTAEEVKKQIEHKHFSANFLLFSLSAMGEHKVNLKELKAVKPSLC